MAASPVEAVLIHAVYLLNCASEDPEIREKTLAVADPVAARRRRDRRAPASCCTRVGQAAVTSAAAIARAGGVIARALGETERCQLHLEDTAGAGGTLGRSFEELARLIDAAGGDARRAVPGLLPSARLRLRHPHRGRADRHAGPLRPRSPASTAWARCTSTTRMTPLGSNRDRHAPPGEGELGERGPAAFLSEPRFEDSGLRAGDRERDGQGPDRATSSSRRRCVKRGSAARARAESTPAPPRADTFICARVASRADEPERHRRRRRAGRVRHHRQPGAQDDAALAVPA